MKNCFMIIFLSAALMLSCRQPDPAPKTIIYAQYVKDSLEIYISAPPRMDTGLAYNVVYYCDANLKSGKKLRSLLKDRRYEQRTNSTIFVGIGHMGNYHVLRRRDFILPRINKGDTTGKAADYGQTESFYRFLKYELVPKINATYKTNTGNNSLAGHSLAGLFVFYCLFKNEDLFRNYYAISPSLWIDFYSIYRFNKLSKEGMPVKNLYFSTGGLEMLNRIKSGTNKMAAFLKAQQYENLNYKYEIHSWKTHNSQVERSLDYLLRQN